MKTRNALGGLLRRRECLIPSWQGLLLLMLIGIALTATAVLNIHPFLSVTAPVPAEVLVVEGWVPDYVLEEAKAEFERHPYRKLYVTGGALERGEHLSEYKTYADLSAATLVKMGMSNSAVEAVVAPIVQKDRTYASGLALKHRLSVRGEAVAGINLVSFSAHARRSRFLFQRAFGDDLKVGVIAIQSREYDPGRWWAFSAGVRNVIHEFVAYIYVLVVFSAQLTHESSA